MSWNYRVVRLDNHLRVYDVYYDESGAPISRHAEPTYIYGDTIEHLREQLAWINAALEKPILDDGEIGSAES